MYIIFLAVLAIYNVLLPLFFAWKNRNTLPVPATEEARIKGYIEIIILGWGSALVVLLLCLFAGISFYDIGLREISLAPNIWVTVITFILCGIYMLAYIGETIAYLVNPKYREEQKETLAKRHPNGSVNKLLPRSKTERKYWVFVSLTAGICEEIIFRGFLFYFLQAVFPNMPILFVVVVSSTVFGIAHAYQGIRGMRNTALVGALHGVLFLATGSLILPMFMHFIVDISSVFLLSEDTE